MRFKAFLAGILVVLASATSAETYQQKVRCLSEVVYQEARGESYRGQLAVAQTVLNRAKSVHFPNTVCGVVFQKNQFSWTRTWNQSWNADRGSIQVAKVALMGTHSLKNFNALYFHSTSIKPPWKRQYLTTIDNHVFYK
jgi:spore germination cell wall hydrolase CwlJ-like protein